MENINNKILLSFVTSCIDELEYLRKTYYDNVKKYTGNNNIEFILINFSENETDGITEYLTINLYDEIKSGKLKYYIKSKSHDEFNIASFKNISFMLANGKYLYNLDCDNYLDGNEYINLEKSIELYGENIVIHQNDGPSQILYGKFIDFNLSIPNLDNDLIWNETTSRICFNKETFIDIGGYNENDVFNKIDSNINLLLRLINSDSRYIHIGLKFENKKPCVNKSPNKYLCNRELAIKDIYSEESEEDIRIKLKQNIANYNM